MKKFHTYLLDWYDDKGRDLPWRIHPKWHMRPKAMQQGQIPNPYHVWLSEVMLQQTTVATVRGYFDTFITLWPTLEALAKADEEDILKAWAGLGYYSRARNLKKCADQIMKEYNGEFPRTQRQLKALAGIGDYTSAAILAIAFNIRALVVDGNVERVATRYCANKTPLPKAKPDCYAFMEQYTPNHRVGDFVQAMMDLGATICTPKSPQCDLCPVKQGCKAKALGTMTDFPVKLPKKAKPERKGAVFVIQREDGAIWLEKRADKGLLAGMSGLPTTAWNAGQDGTTGLEEAPFSLSKTVWQNCGSIRHTFTHFHLTLEVWYAYILHDPMKLPGQNIPSENIGHNRNWWSALENIEKEALPTVMRKALNLALKNKS